MTTPNEEAPEQWMLKGAEKHARKTLPDKADYEDYSQGVKANFIAGIKFGLKQAQAASEAKAEPSLAEVEAWLADEPQAFKQTIRHIEQAKAALARKGAS